MRPLLGRFSLATGDGRRRLARAAALGVALWASPALASDVYAVRFEGVPADFEQRAELVSALVQERRPIATAAAVRRAGRNDARLIAEALRAGGYYRAQTTFRLEAPEADGRLGAVFDVEPGPLFRIVEHRIVFLDAGDPERPATPQDLGLDFGDAASGAALQGNQRQFLDALADAGYPDALSVDRRAEIVDAAGAARAVYEMSSGPRARFGAIRIEGADRVRPDYIRRIVPWDEDATFSRTELVEYRDALARTGLFDEVDVALGDVGPDGRAEVVVDVAERPRRTIGVGASYSTVEGPGGRVYLERRNLFGAGERARIDLRASQVEQSADLTFNKPLPRLPGSAFAELSLTNEDNSAFRATTVEASAGLSKLWLADRLETRGSLKAVASRQSRAPVAPNARSASGREWVTLISFPLLAIWDTEDDPLTLATGERLSLALKPFAGSASFAQAEFNARSRVRFGPGDRFAVAGRLRLGSTVGARTAEVPGTERFYAGGGASIRGYGFQLAGPVNIEGDPLGGLSVGEVAVEGRARVFGKVQAAVFVDAGAVGLESALDFSGDIFVGAGAGLRYFSPIGPIRVDVATPLERREIDDPVQFYISLGQPF